jgi:ABC-type cobalamin transport system permease subunit
MSILHRLTEAPLMASITTAAILGCVLFVLYRWRIVHQSRERKRLYFIGSAIVIVIGALEAYTRSNI